MLIRIAHHAGPNVTQHFLLLVRWHAKWKRRVAISMHVALLWV